MTPDQAADESARRSRSVLGPQSSSLVLASASPRRRELLAALGVPFRVESADIDERIEPGADPAAAAVRLAHEKAAAVRERLPAATILGADTIVVLDGHILGKPADAAEATAMLLALRGRSHTVITGVALLLGTIERFAAPASTVWMRDYTDAEIARSIAAGTPFDKAGAYAIQDTAFRPVQRLDGCYCNVMGLPLWTVRRALMEACPSTVALPPSRSREVCRECPLAERATGFGGW
jgi:septum formation protein